MSNVRLTLGFLVALVSLLALALARADDWPQWRGPKRDGHSRETGLLKEWPKDGPRLIWQVNDLGSGYSTPSVVTGIPDSPIKQTRTSFILALLR
jgi:hypothetical protein